MELIERMRGCLLGLAVGDAVGTTLEFKAPGSFKPLTDMVGGGPFDLEPGQWTDDTSMALCLAESLIEKNGFEPRDQMERYCRWAEAGHFSPKGYCFDIGNTVSAALRRFRATGNPIAGSVDPGTAGNGSIMRLAPVPIRYFPDLEAMVRFSRDSSRTTHGAPECLDACALLAEILHRALSGQEKEAVLAGHTVKLDSPKISEIGGGLYRRKAESQIRGTGYVVASLEAALWSFATTDSFAEAVLKASNLGDDADTTAAICGQVAGAFYGESGIPEEWLEKLYLRDVIGVMAEQLAAR